MASETLPPRLHAIREAAQRALSELEPAGLPRGEEAKRVWEARRTDGGRDLPHYFLVYFLLVDLLGFENLGRWEKVAWIVPIRYKERLYTVEHRKMGLGIFAPTLEPLGKPTEEAESDARQISALIKKGVSIAEPYFEWRAEQEAAGSRLNVVNNSDWLFERYEYFRDHFHALRDEAKAREHERPRKEERTVRGVVVTIITLPWMELRKSAEWNAQAGVEAFFSWTEHAFIHLAILQGYIQSGDEVAKLAAAQWRDKFKRALPVSDLQTKAHYDRLISLRAQSRNYMAHGAFGKRGEAFQFHSGAGAVPVLLTSDQSHRYTLTGAPAFDEERALRDIEEFIDHLWSGSREPAREYIQSGLPSILTYVANGTYAQAMQSVEEMHEFVEHMNHEVDNASNMDW